MMGLEGSDEIVTYCVLTTSTEYAIRNTNKLLSKYYTTFYDYRAQNAIT